MTSSDDAVRLDRVSVEGPRRSLVRVDLRTWCDILPPFRSPRETLALHSILEPGQTRDKPPADISKEREFKRVDVIALGGS